MKAYEIMKCRRQALGLTIEELAKEANLDVREVEFYESGKKMATYVNDSIKQTLWRLFSNMDSITHYKRRILELALEINKEEEIDYMLKQIGHMMVELGKLQMDTMDNL